MPTLPNDTWQPPAEKDESLRAALKPWLNSRREYFKREWNECGNSKLDKTIFVTVQSWAIAFPLLVICLVIGPGNFIALAILLTLFALIALSEY